MIMAKLRSGIDDLVKLLEMVDEREENGEEFTEEELKQAFIREEVAPSSEITVNQVTLDLTTSIIHPTSSIDHSHPSSGPEQLTNGHTTSSTVPQSQPSTCSGSSSSVVEVQFNGSSSNDTIPMMVNIKTELDEEIPKGNIEPKNETKDLPEESVNGPDQMNSPIDSIVNLTINSGNSMNGENNNVNGDGDRSVVGERREDEDKKLSDREDDNVTNDSPYFAFSMVDHSITRGNNGRCLYHCNVCTAVYRHSFSLKRHFIRTHINYAFLSDTDLGSCSISNPHLSDSYLAWITSRASSSSSPPVLPPLPSSSSSTSTPIPSTVPIISVPIDTPSTSNGYSSTVNGVLNDLEVPSTSTASPRSIVEHNQPPKSKGLYCCHACVMFFDRLKGLREHLASVHLNDSTGSLEPVRLPCHRCDASFIHRPSLDEHINSVHAIDQQQPSTSSTSTTAAAAVAVAALTSSTSTSPVPRSTTAKEGKPDKGKRKKGPSSYSTSSSSGCDQKNSSSEDKCDGDDSRSSSERIWINCSLCPYKCKSSEQFKKHNSNRHPTSMFKCAYCKTLFVEKKHIIDHLSEVHCKTLSANSRNLRSTGESKISSIVSIDTLQSTGGTVPSPSSTPVPSTSTTTTAQRSKNLISTRSHKRRCVNRRGANYNENSNYDDLFECHECFETFNYATELLKHAETVHNPSRNTRSSANSMSDAEFYQSLAQKISENLLYHVDGIPKNQAQNDGTNGQDKPTTATQVSTTIQSVTFNLQDYNFPPGFRLYSDDDDNQDGPKVDGEKTLSIAQQVNNKISKNENESKEKEPEKEGDNHKNNSTVDIDNNTNNGSVVSPNNQLTSTPPPTLPTSSSSSPTTKLGRIIYICDACGNPFDSLKLFDQHEINNHPNVFCSYTEIDSNHNIPIGLFKHQVYSPNGILKSCKVPVIASSKSEPSIKCTKCHNKFSTASDLYKHIFECSSKSKRKSKPPIKASSSPVSLTTSSSSSSSSSTEPPSMAITPPPTNAIPTTKNINNQNKKPKATKSPHQQVSSSPPSTPTPATPSLDSVPSPSPSTSSSTSTLSNCSLSASSSSSKKAQQSPANVSVTPSNRRSGQQQGNRSIPDEDSILASLSYNTRSSAKRKMDDIGMDGDCSFNLVKKRNRKVRYTCPNCNEIFTHHLTFAKHTKECDKDEEEIPCPVEKTKKPVNNANNSNTNSSTAPTALTSSSPSKGTKRKTIPYLSRMELKQRLAKRNVEQLRNQKSKSRRGKARKGPIGKATRGDKR